MIEVQASERIAVAAKLDMNEQYLYQCLTRRRDLSLERCPSVEMAFGGRVTCEELRPDVRWARVPDPDWPHPHGRPAIDVAAPAATPQPEDADQ